MGGMGGRDGMDGADLELFERSLRNATEQHTGAALDAALDELGWLDALEVDPEAAVSVLFERQGAANATSAAIDHVVLNALGIEHDGGIVLPSLGGAVAPGELRDDRLTIAGMSTAALATHEQALVVARSDGEEVVVVLPTAALTLRTVEGIDPALGLIEVGGDAIAVEGNISVRSVADSATSRTLIGRSRVGDWGAAVARAQVAVSHELIGASRTMLELAREHALERIQFGQPIAMFQAVRHRLADTLVAIETADAVLDAAWLDESPETAAMAKALAGRGARTAARHCQQVLAGIGFTTEHDLHRSIRRVFVLDELFGSARNLTKTLGDDLLASRQLPPLLPL